MVIKFSNCSLIGSCTVNDTFLPEFGMSPTFINGVVAPNCPYRCLSIFFFVNTLFAASTASLKLLIRNKTQYNLLGNVFLNSSRICGCP